MVAYVNKIRRGSSRFCAQFGREIGFPITTLIIMRFPPYSPISTCHRGYIYKYEKEVMRGEEKRKEGKNAEWKSKRGKRKI